MEQYLRLAAPCRKAGSYWRHEFSGDIVLRRFYSYKELSVSFSKRAARVRDCMAEGMLAQGILSKEQFEEYLGQFSLLCTGEQVFFERSWEEIYEEIAGLRLKLLGEAAIEQMRRAQKERGSEFAPCNVDQRKKIDARIQSAKAVIMALCEAEFYPKMERDLQKMAGKEVYFLVSDAPGRLLPQEGFLPCGYRYLPVEKEIAFDADLQAQIDGGDAFLLVYGEEGFLNCRDLLVDSAVYGVARGYQSRAVLNQMDGEFAAAVYVPAGFDVTEWVRITSATRISYWHLARLWETYGDEIYDCTPLELYQRYPQFFMDIYQSGTAFRDWGIPMEPCDSMEDFDGKREQAIKQYLDGFENITYRSAYFDENLEERDMERDRNRPQAGILVHTVQVKKAKNARVISCEKGSGLRKTFEKMGEQGSGVVSNFLFFLTSRLANLYNELRKDRPYEQADVAAGHLDYMLFEKEGKRIETFPLFRKTCLAMKENGEFLFFNFRLGGGTLTFGGEELSWGAKNVDPQAPNGSVCIYTPYFSLEDEQEDHNTYRKAVGEGRVNIVILQDKITCVRQGDVILPGMGVVVSLDKEAGARLLEKAALPKLEDGYFDPKGAEFSLRLDAPSEVNPAKWEKVRWAYGGGLSLIVGGEALTDREDTDSWFREEGWMSPLSRQTQESSLHTMVKHPRTAIGTTKDGDLLILVFSGRTWRSSGADYGEMIAITRKLFPEVHFLMNVDGGGSAMLGMVQDGKFMELSCPSTSLGSIVGMVRPINTVFYLPAEEK